MKRIQKTIYIIPILFAIVACNVATPVPVSITSTGMPASSSTITPYILPTPTNDAWQNAHIKEQCPNILPSTSLSTINTNGVAVLLKYHYLDDIRDGYLLNLKNKQLFEFSQQGENLSYYSLPVSPNRKTLAYGIVTPKDESIKLVLSNSVGERLAIILIQSDLPYPMYGNVRIWLNDQQLLLDGNVFNPYTGEKQIFNSEDLPDISPDDFGVYLSILNPELTRAIYPHFGGTIAMADLATKQVLAELQAHYAGKLEVVWSPKGNLVAIVAAGQANQDNAEEIFVVDRDGKEITQITHLSNYYNAEYGLFNPSWSPDGSHLAFWQDDFANPNTKGLRLFVLDTKTEELTSYCTWGNPTNQRFYGPIWSPNGTQLLIGDISTKDTVRAVVLDIDKNVAIPIADDVVPVGWMVAP